MSRDLFLGLGDEIINDFLKDLLVDKNEHVQRLEMIAEQNYIDLKLKGSYKSMKGKARYKLHLEEFSEDLTNPRTILFTVEPVGMFSKMALGSIKMFKKKLEPSVVVEKNLLTINLCSIIERWKPEFTYLIKDYSLGNFEIKPGIIIADFTKRKG